VVRRFAEAAGWPNKPASAASKIHRRAGYLLSQFLSAAHQPPHRPMGGSLENRARLLLDVVKAVRAVVTPQFCVGVKLNSADFQRGGFAAEDAREVGACSTACRWT